jgi:hypothetical protein
VRTDGELREHDVGPGLHALGQLLVDDVPLRVHDGLVLAGVVQPDLQPSAGGGVNMQQCAPASSAARRGPGRCAVLCFAGLYRAELCCAVPSCAELSG